jgi:XTP/dITP diphosphohydrolase
VNALVLASRNAKKARELEALLAPLGWQVRPVSEFTDVEPVESGESFVENALIKARHACAVSGLPAIADDSGLCVDALDGAPGVRSARYAGDPASDEANNRLLLERLAEVPGDRRGAEFVCVLVRLLHAQDPLPLIAQGRWRGRILPAPRGNRGFGYDPLFFVPGHDCASAELEPELKNRLSHRGQAMTRLLALLREESR